MLVKDISDYDALGDMIGETSGEFTLVAATEVMAPVVEFENISEEALAKRTSTLVVLVPDLPTTLRIWPSFSR